MAAEKSTAIVLRVIEFSETSCIVTMMTRDFGKITVMAKGARRPKSAFEAALDVLASVRIVFLHKTNGTMSLLTEAKLERRFRSSATDLDRLYAGYYVVELLNSLTDDGDPQPDLFELADQTIKDIDTRESDLANTLMDFELKTLEILGHLPMLTKCVSCGKEKTTLARVSFGLNAGGILCASCRRGQTHVVSLSPNGLQNLLSKVGGQIGANEKNSDNWNSKTLKVKETPGELWPIRDKNHEASRTSTIETATELKTDADEQFHDLKKADKEVRQLVNKYITHLLGFPPRLHKFLKNI